MEATRATRNHFPTPFEVQIPTACEGWEEMYPYHALFSEDRRESDEGRFWFQDGLHYPDPFHPFDALQFATGITALNQASSRLFVVPTSLGVEYRVLNGYIYFSANSVTDETTLAHRAELFARRGGYYYEHWDELYARWLDKVAAAMRELEALVVPDLPELEDESVITEGRGWGTSHELLLAYDRLLEGYERAWQYHFEFLNLGYGAYLVLYDLCRRVFPGIEDRTIAKMVSGIDLVLNRPDDELRRLAELAVELGVVERVRAAGSEEELRAGLEGSEGGSRWLAEFERAKDPWFHFSYGSGVYHYHRSWLDDPALPIAAIGAYAERLQAGEDISRPTEAVLAERDRITTEHHALLSGEMRQAFDQQLGLARTVFRYVEDHNFYIDHWYFGLFWNKAREFGALLARHEFLAEGEDVFFLRHDEVRTALEELALLWSSGGAGVARGPVYWPALVARRKSIHAAMREWTPPPALGSTSASITEPFTVMLWGITPERVQEWLASSDGAGPEERVLTGFAGSPGVAEGRARVILHVDQLHELEEGEILVAPSTSTSWTPVFGTVAAAVSDVGGIMSHGAVVAREYGLPAVVGTGVGTRRIRTGDRVRVDGDAGVVTVLGERVREQP
jgi:pyruvate,water dikinase